MNCKKCGNPITDFDKFCQNCGEPNELYNGGNQVETSFAPIDAAPVEPAPVEPTAVDPVVSQTPVEPTITPAEPIVQQAAKIPAMQEQQPVPGAQIPNANIASTPVQAPVPKKKSNAPFIIIIIILSLIIIGIGIFIVFKLLGNNGNTNTVENKPIEDKTEPTKVADKETFEVSGYTFTIPRGFTKVTDNNNKTYIGDNTFYFGFMKVTNIYTYDVLKSQLPNLATTYINKWQNEGVTYVGNNEYTYSGKKFLVITFNSNGVYTDIILTELKDNSILTAFVYYKDVSAKEAGYKKMVEFVNSGSKNEASSFSANTNDTETVNQSGSLGNKVDFE